MFKKALSHSHKTDTIQLQFKYIFYNNSHKPWQVLDPTKTQFQYGFKTHWCMGNQVGSPTLVPCTFLQQQHSPLLLLPSSQSSIIMSATKSGYFLLQDFSLQCNWLAAPVYQKTPETQGMSPDEGRRAKKKAACSPQSNVTYGLTNTQLAQPSKNKHSQSHAPVPTAELSPFILADIWGAT